VNGVEVLSVSGVQTADGSSAEECSQIAFPGRSTTYITNAFYTSQIHWDDIYVYDTSGSYNNDWMGDRRVRQLLPSADTAQADWTGSYTDVDDSDPDDDTTYISAAAPGSPAEFTSEFDLPNLTGTDGDVAAVVVKSRLLKTYAGQAEYQAGLVSGASESRGTVRPATTTNYVYHEDVFETDPSSGVAFTPSDVNGLKLQVNRVT
jgi:hypothetical protein